MALILKFVSFSCFDFCLQSHHVQRRAITIAAATMAMIPIATTIQTSKYAWICLYGGTEMATGTETVVITMRTRMGPSTTTMEKVEQFILPRVAILRARNKGF